jgi:hypothetical protein
MRGFLQMREPERTGTALDGMGGPEDRVQIFAIGCLDIEIDKQTFHFVEQLVCFIEKGLVELGDI